jgi:hypothetical protein
VVPLKQKKERIQSSDLPKSLPASDHCFTSLPGVLEYFRDENVAKPPAVIE